MKLRDVPDLRVEGRKKIEKLVSRNKTIFFNSDETFDESSSSFRVQWEEQKKLEKERNSAAR
jgi:hypothetical protein